MQIVIIFPVIRAKRPGQKMLKLLYSFFRPRLFGMINFLRKTFIPNCNDLRDETVRAKHGVLAAWLGLLINAILVAMKLTLAFLLASSNLWIFPMALLADAMDNAGDMASNIVTLIGFRVSSKPADDKHPFGHERIEYIAGLIVSMLILFAGVELIVSSIEGIIEGAGVFYNWWTVGVLCISILLKVLQGFMNLRLAKIIDSPSLKATAVDSFVDTLATFAVLLSALLSILFHLDFLDGYFGIGVAIFIIVSAIKMLQATSDPLIGKAFSKKEEQEIVALAKKHPEILGVHDVLMHQYGPTKIYISLHAEVVGTTSLVEAHDIANRLEEEINAAYHAETTIHIDPVEQEEIDGGKKAQALIAAICPNASLHDFRIRKKQEGIEITMDIALDDQDEDKKKALIQSLKKGFEGAKLQIKFEHSYSC